MERKQIESILNKEISSDEMVSSLLDLFHSELTPAKEQAKESDEKVQAAQEILDNRVNDLTKQIEEKQAELEDMQSKLEEANTTINDLKQNEPDLDKINELLRESQERVETLEAQSRKDKINFAIESKLKDARAIDPKFARVGLDMEKIQIDENGEVVGIDEQVEELRKNKQFLFETGEKINPTPDYKPRKGNAKDKPLGYGKSFADKFNKENQELKERNGN